jgi:hypothetical protein
MNRTLAAICVVSVFSLAHLALTSLVFAQTVPDTVKPARAERQAPASTTLSGFILAAAGPVADATVRVQATDHQAISAADGSFVLTGLRAGQLVTVTASASGHYIGWVAAKPGAAPVSITLKRHYETDNFAYEWFEQDGVQGSAACGRCHTSYQEWLADGHSQSATNEHFLSMYAGTDIHGNKSPQVKKNNLGVPLPADLTKPYYGPGFKLDFPNIAGNCATCHTPMAAKMPNVQNCGWSGCHKDSTAATAGTLLDPGVSPLGLTGDAAEGISCEFCHKIGQVHINRKTGLPYPDMPGILSLRLYRPAEDHDLIFGSVDDIARTDIPEARDVHLPLLKDSTFCAGCHYGILGGVVVGNMATKGGVLVYSSYSEWLESPYSDKETGKTCQDCHMQSGDHDYFAWPAEGGVIRSPEQVHNHQMMSGELLQDAVMLTATAAISTGLVVVNVDLTNDKTGHHVPTDSPLRQAILVVTAKDASDEPLPLRRGPVLPWWTGDYAGQPGRAYAKILRDEWTGEMPTGAIWRPVTVAEDTRLAAMATDTSRYEFRSPPSGDVTVEVRLIYRKAYQQLMQWKGWTDPDIVMEEATLHVAASP